MTYLRAKQISKHEKLEKWDTLRNTSRSTGLTLKGDDQAVTSHSCYRTSSRVEADFTWITAVRWRCVPSYTLKSKIHISWIFYHLFKCPTTSDCCYCTRSGDNAEFHFFPVHFQIFGIEFEFLNISYYLIAFYTTKAIVFSKLLVCDTFLIIM